MGHNSDSLYKASNFLDLIAFTLLVVLPHLIGICDPGEFGILLFAKVFTVTAATRFSG